MTTRGPKQSPSPPKAIDVTLHLHRVWPIEGRKPKNNAAFLDYLAEIEAATPPEVREQAARIYGVETGA